LQSIFAAAFKRGFNGNDNGDPIPTLALPLKGQRFAIAFLWLLSLAKCIDHHTRHPADLYSPGWRAWCAHRTQQRSVRYDPNIAILALCQKQARPSPLCN
jgi:hypothetical protein